MTADLVVTFGLLVQLFATDAGISPEYMACIVEQESRWDYTATGLAGEIGLGQILPSTGAWFAGKMGLASYAYDLRAPVDNLRITAWGLRYDRRHWSTRHRCEHLWVEPHDTDERRGDHGDDQSAGDAISWWQIQAGAVDHPVFSAAPRIR